MAPKIPHRSTVDRPALLALAATLNPTGVLKTLEKERYSYLDIDDDFIHYCIPCCVMRRFRNPIILEVA